MLVVNGAMCIHSLSALKLINYISCHFLFASHEVKITQAQ